MMRVHVLLLGLMIALAGPVAGPVVAQMKGITAPAPVRAPTPKVVMQTVGEIGVDVAAWLPGTPFVLSASGLGRELLIWDEPHGVIVDRLRLPVPPNAAVDVVLLQRMEVWGDGQTVRLFGVAIDRRRAGTLLNVEYDVNLQTRTVDYVPQPAARVLATRGQKRVLNEMTVSFDTEALFQRWVLALEAVYQGGDRISLEEAATVLPVLPFSGDGRRRLVRAGMSLGVKEDGKPVRLLATQGQTLGFDDAALSTDGRWLAMMDSLPEQSGADETPAETPIELYELTTGRFGADVRLPGDYDAVAWLDAREFIAMEESDGDPTVDGTDGAPDGTGLPMLVVDADSGNIVRRIEPRCHTQVVRGGDLIGAGLANCRREVGDDRLLQRFDPARAAWRPLKGLEIIGDARVLGLAVSPGGDRLAVAGDDGDGATLIILLDLGSETEIGRTALEKGRGFSAMAFAPDGNRLAIAANAGVSVWDFAGEKIDDMDLRAYAPDFLVSDGRVLLVGGELEARLSMLDMASGRALLSPLSGMNITAGGFVPGKPLFWGVNREGDLWVWETERWGLLTRTVFFGGQKMAALARDGRYDTNLGPDDQRFRWLMPDARWQPLAPQTFMRDYFEPQLVRKTIDCTLAGDCARVLKPVPPIAGLNRLLPEVRVTSVALADAPGQVVVKVEARETRDARTGRTSGLYGVKLLLDGRQIDQVPPHFQSFELPPNPTVAQWREVNAIDERDADGVLRLEFQVSVPTLHDGGAMEFAAYAFNSDRVKSDTARLEWTPPSGADAMPKRPRRAFVLTIGVDDYDEERLDLNFAVADAGLIAERLVQIPGYEMHHIRLTSAPARDGKPARHVTRADILGTLSMLSGFPPEMDQAIRLHDVHGATALTETTADDLVIISFSGHGYADAGGNFSLVPSDARWPADADGPMSRSVISAADLTVWLGFMQASEIAFIIDACHSAASVATPDFKPGPMGDPGLGQLAFDKGLRILAATQSDDVALEISSLKQGMLTAALGEGLTPGGGPADIDQDGRVLLDEWLRYAVARLPSLNEEVRRGGGPMAARGVRVVMRRPEGVAAAPRVQEPSLFDFNAAPSAVVLRGQP
jgi:hypothetical protein